MLQAKPIDDGVHVSTLTRLRARAKPGQVHKLLVALVVPTRERDTPGTRRSVRVRAGLGPAVRAHPSGYEVLRGPTAFPRAGVRTVAWENIPGPQAVCSLITSATRSSGWPAKPRSTGMSGSSVSLMKRSADSFESETAAMRIPPSVGPAAW